jgi:hypothetical protein
MTREIRLPDPNSRLVLGIAALTVLALAALLFRVGADAQWLAALGRVIDARHAVPAGVPFALAPTAHWSNTVVLGELVFAGLENTLGDSGLMLAQLLAVTGALTVLTRDALAGGATRGGTGAALLLAGVGALPSLAIARGQLFSLALFPVVAILLRAESRRPSRRIWWVVPLLALWSNLHGAVLLGLLVLLVYLALERGRREPLLAIAVAAAGCLALLTTPAGVGTVGYFRGVLSNVAAQRGMGMWGPLSLTSPLDLVLALCAVVLIRRAWRSRPAPWEIAVGAILVLLTIKAQRDGVWLLMFLIVPAARSLAARRALSALAPIAAVLAVLALTVSAVRGPVSLGASPSLLASALKSAAGSPILADGVIDEQVALAGGRIWAGNPIDAFTHRVQAAYLDWTDGLASGSQAVSPAVRVAVVLRGSPTQALMARMASFAPAGHDAVAVVYERRS